MPSAAASSYKGGTPCSARAKLEKKKQERDQKTKEKQSTLTLTADEAKHAQFLGGEALTGMFKND